MKTQRNPFITTIIPFLFAQFCTFIIYWIVYERTKEVDRVINREFDIYEVNNLVWIFWVFLAGLMKPWANKQTHDITTFRRLMIYTGWTFLFYSIIFITTAKSVYENSVKLEDLLVRLIGAAILLVIGLFISYLTKLVFQKFIGPPNTEP